MTALAKFLTSMSTTAKAVSALCGAVAIGVVIGVSLMGFIGLPDKLAALETQVDSNTEWREQHTREFKALVCLLTLPDSVDRREQMRQCGL